MLDSYRENVTNPKIYDLFLANLLTTAPLSTITQTSFDDVTQMWTVITNETKEGKE